MRKIIHIGANKTASTTLQRSYFSKSKFINYMGEDGNRYNEYASILNSMVLDDDLYFDESECRKLFNRFLKKTPPQTFIFSNEDVMTTHIPAICAKRIYSFIGNASVLLVIRNQYKAIESFYANHGAFLKPAPLSYFRKHVDFDDWIDHQLRFDKYGAFASFKYHSILKIYENLFGKSNIHILFFEDFINDKKSFSYNLADILKLPKEEAYKLIEGSHERKRITNRSLLYNRFRTNFFWGVNFSSYLPFSAFFSNNFNKFLLSGRPAEIKMSDKTRKKVYDFYKKDNFLLASKYNLALSKHGYPI